MPLRAVFLPLGGNSGGEQARFGRNRCHTPRIFSVNATSSGRIARASPIRERASMPELSSTQLLITAVICGVLVGAAVAAGVLVVSRRAHGRWPRGVKPGSDPTDLLDRAVALDSQLSHLTNLTLEVLTRQSSAATKLDSAAEMTQELHLILANPKQRGDWGEILAEDVLRHAGLQNHISYTRQQTLRYGNGRPDFTFTMPDGRELHLDAKFPLENYRRMEKADTDEHRQQACTAFARDIKNHIKALPGRGYADPEHTVGFCLLFIANKAIFDTITEADPDILQYALSQHVVICCPQTLMSVLLLVRNAANTFRVQRRTLDVIACIEGFQAQWREFTKHLHTADKQLNTFCRTWETLNSTRRNQLQKQLDRIDELDVHDAPAPVSHADAFDAGTAPDTDQPPNLPSAAFGSAG